MHIKTDVRGIRLHTNGSDLKWKTIGAFADPVDGNGLLHLYIYIYM